MDRRTYIEGVGAIVTTGAIAGCTGSGPTEDGTDGGNGDGSSSDPDDGGRGDPEYGVLSTSVTDQPNDIADFESLVVTIEGIWVKPAGSDGEDEESDDDGDDGDESESDDEPTSTATESGADGGATPTERDEDGEENGDEAEGDDEESDGEEGDEEEDEDESGDGDRGNSGRYYIEFDESQEADLVELQGDNTQLVDETELEVGEYQFLQLNVAGTNGVLVEGGEASVETPGNAPLQFKQAFEIRAEETTRFIADFAPFRRGNGSYLIRPVASGTQVLYGDGEADDGTATETEDETDDGGTTETDADESDDGSGGSPDDAGAGNAGDDS
jgi:hypothetical protein